jgi:Acyl-CoA dehydrogenases
LPGAARLGEEGTTFRNASLAAMAETFRAETRARAVDPCPQLFGGYGSMLEYPIARLHADARVTRLHVGTSEVMKVIVAESLGL